MGWKDFSKLILLFLAIVLVPTVIVDAGALRYGGDQAAYDASPPCDSTADVSNCRYEGSATVVSTLVAKYSQLWVTVSFDQLNGQKAAGVAGDQLASAWKTWKPGDKLDAEMWHGSITKIAEVRTDSNPHNLMGSYGPLSLILTAVAIALVAMFVAARIVIWRQARLPKFLSTVPPAAPWR